MAIPMNSFPPLAELNESRLTEIVSAAGEPEWLIERRVTAWRHFAETAPPFWKRTDLTKLAPEVIRAPLDAQGTPLEWDASLAGQGVIFTTLAAAVRDHAELVQRYFGTAIDPLAHKFSALHAALWQDGVFLYVPKNLAIETPIRVVYSINGNAIFPHSLVIIERGANVAFIEEFASINGNEQRFAAPVTELFVGEGATLRFVSAQMWGNNVYHIGAQRALVSHDGNVAWVAANLGGQLQHVEAETSLEGNGSKVEWVAATLGNTNQTLLTAPWLRHVGANTEAHMNFKTVVKDSAYAIFDGMIKIEHNSRGTSTRLEEHALHLSPKARSDSIPGLKIDTNDVQRAGHASTSGQVDDEQLFYMLSRGIKREDAIHMIVTGFFEPVLDQIPLEELRERIGAAIEAKI